MIDQAHIDELKETLGKKEAKEALIQYALDEYGITLKRVKRSFDFLVEELREHLQKLADVPPPEDQSGVSTTDLTFADDTLKGAVNIADSDREPNPEALILLGGGLIEPTEKIDPKDVFDIPVGNPTPIEPTPEQISKVVATITRDETPRKIELEIKLENPISDETPDEVQPKVENELFELPPNFSPMLTKLGTGDGFVTLPWWIFEYIQKTPNWKSNPDACPQHHAIATLKSLIYYIKKDGKINIRETRNSRFHTLN